jgi:hypothetical protein
MFRISVLKTAAVIPAALVAVALAGIAGSSALGASSASNPDELYGGKVPMKVLIDNDKVRVNLLTFPQGYERHRHFARRSDQLIVYLDDGQLSTLSPSGDSTGNAAEQPGSASERPGKPVICGALSDQCGPVTPAGVAPADGLEPRGSVSWRPKGTDAVPIRVEKGYRALYIEFKHGTMTAPDPAASDLPYEQVTGGGAPVHVLIDNAVMRANLIDFPEGFIRPGNLRRHYDTVIVYIDDGKLADVAPPPHKYAVVQAFSHHPDARAVCDPIKDCDSVAPDGKWAHGSPTLRGTVAWHPKDGYVENLRIGMAYRALYIELK